LGPNTIEANLRRGSKIEGGKECAKRDIDAQLRNEAK